MNRLLLASTLFFACMIAACDKPVVVNNPAPVIGAPGPAGPQGATGNPGDSPAIIVMPAASAPAN